MATAKKIQPEPTPTEPSKETPTPPTSLVQLPVPQFGLTSREAFELSKDIARAWAGSTIVPEQYKNNPANCLIVIDIAARLNLSPLMLMNVIDVIRGRPAWRSQFIIALINQSGKFKGSLNWTFSGDGMTRAAYAWAIDKATGEKVQGDAITMAQAKAEGWLDRDGSKWKTLPDLMLRYRSAAFFGRVFIPEKLLGLPAVEEVHDIIDVTPEPDVPPKSGIAGAKEMLAG